MALHAAITSHSYVVETDGDESRCCSDEDGSHAASPSWERWYAACVASAFLAIQGLHVFPHLHHFQVCLPWILLAYKCYFALIICVWMGDISTTILCARVCALHKSSWTDRPLLSWRSPRNTTAWGDDALLLRCWKAWRSAFSFRAVIHVPIL